MIGAIGTLGYVMVTPKGGESFTEFYVLGPEGKAEGYPRELWLGEEATVIVGIANHEHEMTEYKVEIAIDDKKVGEIGPIILEHEEEWEEEMAFTPARAGRNQKVEFLLYKVGSTDAYQRLHLWIDVE